MSHIQYGSSNTQTSFEEKKSEAGFCAFFLSLPQKSENTIRLFERNGGDFFSVHGEDAHFVAKVVYKTNTVIKYIGAGEGSQSLPSVTVPRNIAENFVRDLLVTRGFKVEIWIQEPGKKNNSWIIGRKGSPGNLQDFDEILFESTEMATSPVVLAVSVLAKLDQLIVGLAYADASARRLGFCEFVDGETLSNFESLLIQLNVKECLISNEHNLCLKKLSLVCNRAGIVVTTVKKVDFRAHDIEQNVTRLSNQDSLGTIPSKFKYPECLLRLTSQELLECQQASSATACIVQYLELINDETNVGNYSVCVHDLRQYMKLDAAAVRALNLMPRATDGGNKSMCLLGLLDQCRTAQGSRLLSQWIKQPLMQVDAIAKRQNIVEVFCRDAELRQSLQDFQLKSFPDLHRLVKKFQRGTATLQDVIRIYQVVIRLPLILDSLNGYSGDHMDELKEEFTNKLELSVSDLENLQKLVECSIDLEQIENHEYVMKADFHEDLKDCRKQMEAIFAKIDPMVSEIISKLGSEVGKKVKMEKNSQYGHYLRISRNDYKLIRNKPEIIELSTQKNGIYFTTPALRQLSREYVALAEDYEKRQAILVQELLTIVASYSSVLDSLNEIIAKIDVLVSFANVAIHAPVAYVRPVMFTQGSGKLDLAGSRHPCLEVQRDVSFIPNDFRMSRGSSNFHIITGPNMGGKSTYIRQIGVIILMAQIGSFVPCKTASITVVDSILARVGAGDNQLKGVSTFMAEMLETASILKSATEDSLIIIDELGRGTSTYDGFGLAWSISEHIVKNINCFCLFATHFHELTAMSSESPTVANFHVTAHTTSSSITLLYKVLPGVCDQSFGIHVAELANFPEAVVKLAKLKALELEDFNSALKPDGMILYIARCFDNVSICKGSADMDIDGANPSTEAEADKVLADLLVERFLTQLSNIPPTVAADDAQLIKEVQNIVDNFNGLEEWSSNSRISQILSELY